jgi:hypothetical protein
MQNWHALSYNSDGNETERLYLTFFNIADPRKVKRRTRCTSERCPGIQPASVKCLGCGRQSASFENPLYWICNETKAGVVVSTYKSSYDVSTLQGAICRSGVRRPKLSGIVCTRVLLHASLVRGSAQAGWKIKSKQGLVRGVCSLRRRSPQSAFPVPGSGRNNGPERCGENLILLG